MPFCILDAFYTPPRVSPCVCPSARSTYVLLSAGPSLHPFVLRFRSITSIYKRSSFRFCICICTKNVSLGVVNEQILIISDRVMPLVNVQKRVLASSSFTIWSFMMKLHKNDSDSMICISIEVLSLKVICPCRGAKYLYKMMSTKKIYINSEFEAFFSEIYSK